MVFKNLAYLLILAGISPAFAGKMPTYKSLDNQTLTLSTVESQAALPFSISIQQASFQLPVGFHSGAVGEYRGFWIFIAGRTNGLHGFGLTDNFPPDSQNTSIYVVNPRTGQTFSRSLNDAHSGLSQAQINILSVTSPEFFQQGDILFIAGGYGVDSGTATFSTKPFLTAVHLPGIVDWVIKPGNKNNTAAKHIQQLTNPIFKVTGGMMHRIGSVTQLVFGQDFEGEYTPGSEGTYSEQVRQFQINMIGGTLSVDIFNSVPSIPDPNYRRRDLNVFPALLNNNNQLEYGLIANAGVFTTTGGVWTVPVIINGKSNPFMPDPTLPNTFKQAMNQYVCARVGLYSRLYQSNYYLLFGGLSYGFFSSGTFTTDAEIPFINQVTTVQMDKNGNFTQYLMDNEYPTIASTGSNPGNTLLFGTSAYFIQSNIPQYPNKEISLDSITKPTIIGHIVGGIMSTLPNTSTTSDSAASPYVFTVTLIPNSNLKNRYANKLAQVKEPKLAGLQRIAHVEQKMYPKFHLW